MSKKAYNTPFFFAAALAGAVLSLLYCTPLSARQTKFTVRQDGRGDFASISEAVAAVPSESTLIIYEGVYQEQVSINDKTLYLTGQDRDKCIIEYNGSNYFEPPLSIAAGTVSNLTIYCCADKSDGWIDRPPAVVNPEIPQTAYMEYAIHIEQDYLAGRALTFDNCLILSDKNYCVGLGLRKGGSVSFQNCEFRAYGLGGIVFAHDAFDTDLAGECSLRFADCEMYNYKSSYFLSTKSLHMDSHVHLTFQNTQVHTVGYGNADGAYHSENSYTGRTINDLIELDSSELLIENGYRSNDLVFCLDIGQTQKYIAYELSNVSSISHKIPLPEGITRLLGSQIPPASRKEFPIHIDNTELEAHDGWCGSANFYLTPDSGGNTFAEMNYMEALTSAVP